MKMKMMLLVMLMMALCSVDCKKVDSPETKTGTLYHFESMEQYNNIHKYSAVESFDDVNNDVRCYMVGYHSTISISCVKLGKR